MVERRRDRLCFQARDGQSARAVVSRAAGADVVLSNLLRSFGEQSGQPLYRVRVNEKIDMNARYTDLFARIHEHCREQNWYGPDMEAPARYSNRYVRRMSLTTGKQVVYDRQADARVERYLYPPATEDQIQRTEAQLDLPLPPVLRALYTTVGNGGFGPAYGLVGVTGGAPSPNVRPDKNDEAFAELVYSIDDTESAPPAEVIEALVDGHSLTTGHSQREKRGKRPKKDRTLAATLSRNDWRLAERATQALKQNPSRYLECESKPDGLVTLCHWGCAIYSDLDLWTGHIYLTYAVARHDFVGETADITLDDIALGLLYQAASAEEWLDQWLRGDLNQGDPRKFILLSEIMGA